MKVTTSKSKNSESFYIAKSYINNKGNANKQTSLKPQYARYQKSVWDAQIERAEKMLSTGTIKKERRNPNDPARFIGKVVATEDGETAKIHNYLDTEKIEQEALYDGMYAVTTDLLDDDVKDILKVSEGRWNIMPIF